MTGGLRSALLVKEGRALAPIWVGAVATMVAGAQAELFFASLLMFVVGAAALGAFSIGHEYAHHTLTSLLAQPLTRSRLLLSKIVVLAPMLILLSVAAALVLSRAEGIERTLGVGTIGTGWRVAIVLMPALLGLCVAPWLTMLFRSPMAGLVFTLAVPAALWISGQIAYAASLDFDFVAIEVGNPFAYAPTLVLITTGVIVVSIVAAVHGRALFAGLEALDTARDLWPFTLKRLSPAHSAVASDRRGVRRRGPLLLVVQKELRLYGSAVALAALYAVGWTAMWVAGTNAYIAGGSIEALADMYGLFIAVLVGAISVAEERALGTADMQILQPWRFWKLPMVKLATAGFVAVVLGLVVPTGLEAALPLINQPGAVGPTWIYFRFYLPGALAGATATILLTTLFSCYVSSFCVGGLRALLAALLLSFGVSSLYVNLLASVDRLSQTALAGFYGFPQRSLYRLPTATAADFQMMYVYPRRLATLAFIGFVALLLFLYLRNSKSVGRMTSMASAQLPWVAMYVGLSAAVLRGGGALLEWWLFTH
jgi:ABC-type transport system involved in multi-copper enzyme maturation permease subunit